ncbi:retrovirus-related pol polyprotein from transposon TNT 1-94 [Tanacetum coccineum]
MSTLAEFMILSGVDNHPPMLEKHLYDSWKSIMELYMQNREHGRMILESTKNYEELSATKKIQVDCDLKATNIILQALPSDVYSLVNHHRVAKDLWERVQLLMYTNWWPSMRKDIAGGVNEAVARHGVQVSSIPDKDGMYIETDGQSERTFRTLENMFRACVRNLVVVGILTFREAEIGESKMIGLELEQETTKGVTKLVRDLHTTNFDQLHAYLKQHELHANEVCIMRERNQDPLALVANLQMAPLQFNTYQSSYNNPQFQQQFSPSQSPHYGSMHPTQHYSTTYPSTPHAITYPSTSLAVPVFKQGDDPIDAINKMMSFLSTVVSSGRQSSLAAGTSRTRANISRIGRNNSGQQRVVKCFNCQGEDHMARQCPKPKRKIDATWFRDKVLLVEAQGSGKVLNEEELEFLADPGVAEGPVTQTVITHNATYQVDDLDAYDYDCDDFFTAKAVLMANLSSYGSNVLSEVPHFEITHNDMLNQSVQEMQYSEQTHLVNYPENKITSDSNIIPYS